MKYKTPRKNSMWKLVPNLFDRLQENTRYVPAGLKVRVIQPYGCPKNGTMNQCYVENAETKEFIGLVCIGSLVK
jgi:hypothetical protein